MHKQKCHECFHEWYSEERDEVCPVCGEEVNIETDEVEDYLPVNKGV